MPRLGRVHVASLPRGLARVLAAVAIVAELGEVILRHQLTVCIHIRTREKKKKPASAENSNEYAVYYLVRSPTRAYASMRHCKYDAESFRHSSESARMLFSLRHAMYDSFASEHSRKWSSGNEPLSGGLGGNPRDGMEALDAIL